DRTVTGVQTCALPIFSAGSPTHASAYVPPRWPAETALQDTSNDRPDDDDASPSPAPTAGCDCECSRCRPSAASACNWRFRRRTRSEERRVGKECISDG